jgi:hypothetical protein
MTDEELERFVAGFTEDLPTGDPIIDEIRTLLYALRDTGDVSAQVNQGM